MDINQYASERIREIRLEKKLSYEELSKKTQISIYRLQRIENNETKITLKILGLLCKGLGISPQELFKGI